MADFTPEQISAAIARAADYIENADGNVCLDPGEDEHIIAALRTHHATLADMAKRLEAAERAPCQWTQDEHDGSWDTGCGEKHQFTDGNAADNSHTYCPYCGGHLIDSATQEGEG